MYLFIYLFIYSSIYFLFYGHLYSSSSSSSFFSISSSFSSSSFSLHSFSSSSVSSFFFSFSPSNYFFSIFYLFQTAIILVQSAERRRSARAFFALLKVRTKAATFLQRTYRAHLARMAEKSRYVHTCNTYTYVHIYTDTHIHTYVQIFFLRIVAPSL